MPPIVSAHRGQSLSGPDAVPEGMRVDPRGLPRTLDDPALQRLVDQVHTACTEQRRLRIVGGASKAFLCAAAPAGAASCEVLSTRPLAGIVAYEPSELVITARAGTPLAEVEELLVRHQQYLAFEPPQFAGGATAGGMVAAGLSGPGRATRGPVRDFVLGATLLNGRGQVLCFGGQVIKNVAGYDVARLLCGSWGTLGVVLEVSLRVSPAPVGSVTLRIAMEQNDAIRAVNQWLAAALPVDASAWWQGMLTVRLRGANAAVQRAVSVLPGEVVEADVAGTFWEDIRNHAHAFFQHARASGVLWRVSVPPTAPAANWGDGTAELVEWHGGLRWVHAPAPDDRIRRLAQHLGGHATLFHGDAGGVPVLTPLPQPLARIHQRLKQAFDPAGVFHAPAFAGW